MQQSEKVVSELRDLARPRRHGVPEEAALPPLSVVLCVRVVHAAAVDFDGR